MHLDVEACHVPGGGVLFTLLKAERFPSTGGLLACGFPAKVVDPLDHEAGSDALLVG